MKERVRIGIVGCGDVTYRHYLPGFAGVEETTQLAGFYDLDPERRATAAGKFGVPAFGSLDALLNSTSVDAVLNLTPPLRHVTVSLAALGAGKHVLTEKLMAYSLADADRLIEEAVTRDRVLVCAPAVATSSFLVDIRHAVRDGAIGSIVGARVQLSSFGPAAWRVYTSDPTWFYEPGAGPVPDIGVYALHMLTELCGPVRRVAALSGVSVPSRTVQAGPYEGKEITVKVDDNVHMLLDFTEDDGPALYAGLTSTYCAWAVPGPCLEVYGSEGVIAVDNMYDAQGTVRLWRARRDGSSAWEQLAHVAPSRGSTRGMDIFSGVRHLVECIQRGTTPILSGEHARHVLDVILTAERAARSGQTLDVSSRFRYPKDWAAHGL